MIRMKVREIAEAQGLNMQALSDKSGIAYSSIIDLWYDRARVYHKRTLHRLCVALNVTPGDLLVEDGLEEKDETPDPEEAVPVGS